MSNLMGMSHKNNEPLANQGTADNELEQLRAMAAQQTHQFKTTQKNQKALTDMTTQYQQELAPATPTSGKITAPNQSTHSCQEITLWYRQQLQDIIHAGHQSVLANNSESEPELAPSSLSHNL